MIQSVSMIRIAAFVMATAMASHANNPQWPAQDTVMHVSDPDSVDMGQTPIAPGATVYAYVQNTSSIPISLAQMNWNGRNVSELAGSSPYATVWWRLNPKTVPPGGMGEICLRLRHRLADPGTLEAIFSNGDSIVLAVPLHAPNFRIQTLSVAGNRRQVFIYVEQETPGVLPDIILLDGVSVPGRVIWLSAGWVGTPPLRVAMVELDTALVEGAWHTWTVKGGENSTAQAGATLRVISNPGGMGISGLADFERLSGAGFDTLHSFTLLGITHLDNAVSNNMRVIMQIPSPSVIARPYQSHPGVMGYNIFDEPDVADDNQGRGSGRPWGERIGMTAQDMVTLAQDTADAAPLSPVYMTLNMTFMPGNYYTYGPLADITTPDFYAVTHARPAGQIRAAAAQTKRATAPRPFGFYYQCNWEEYSIDISGAPYHGWAGSAAIMEKGWDYFRDKSRTRGFGRPPAGKEVELQIACLLGEGAKVILGYGDVTECCMGLLFHGAIDLPEVWNAVRDMAGKLALVKNEIGLAHPVAWATADQPAVLTRTLLCGRDYALVVAINENYQSVQADFSNTPVASVTLTFPDLPWLQAREVELLSTNGLTSCCVDRIYDGGKWMLPLLENTAIFRVADGVSAASAFDPDGGVFADTGHGQCEHGCDLKRSDTTGNRTGVKSNVGDEK